MSHHRPQVPVYSVFCLLLWFHLLSHTPSHPAPRCVGSLMSAFQFLEVARFFPALGIIFAVLSNHGDLFLVVFFAGSLSLTQNLAFLWRFPWPQWLKSSPTLHCLSTHAVLIIISHSMLFISFNMRKPKLWFLGTCLSPLLDSKLHTEGEDCTCFIHHCSSSTILLPGRKWVLNVYLRLNGRNILRSQLLLDPY